MAEAYITGPRCSVRLRSERLMVLGPDTAGNVAELLQEIPLADLERVTLSEDVQISSHALAALLRAQIPVQFLDRYGRSLGSAVAPPSPDAQWRLRQYERTLDEAFAVETTRRIIEAKIYNQHRLLQRLNATRSQGIEEELGKLADLRRQIAGAPSLPVVRGLEGAATATYFRLWAKFLPEEFPFEHRSCHPPHNAVNACISFGAVLVYHELVAALHIRGLDPGLGMLHATENGRWSLALDLMEPFRPCVVEALALRLFSHRILGEHDFEPNHGGVYLSAAGRRKFLEQYEARLQRPFISEHVGHSTTLRQQIQDQAVQYKTALELPDRLRPFRMN